MTSITFGQTKVDSLLILNQDLEGENKVNNLINISREFFIVGDTQSIKYAKEAIILSDQIGYNEGKGKAMLFLALGSNNTNVDTALYYFVRSGEELDQINHPWAGFGFENGANNYRVRGLYPEALANYIKALDVYKKSNDTVQMCKTISSLGHINYWMKEFETSIQWQKKALMLSKNIDDPALDGLFFGRIGIAFDEMGIFDSAHYYNQLAVKMFKSIDDAYYLSQWYSNIGNTYIKEGKYLEAEKYITEAVNNSGSERLKTTSFTNLASVYTLTKRYNKAKVYLDSAYYLANKYKQKEFLAEIYFRYYEYYKDQQKYKKALSEYNNHFRLKDSILNADKTSQIANMRVRYETEQKENQLLAEIAMRNKLEKENALAEIVILNRNRLLIIIISISLVSIFFLLLMYQRKKRKLQAEQDAAIIKERESGIRAIFDAQEKERSRIAKDLHDGIGQQISSIKLYFQKFIDELNTESTKLLDGAKKISSMITDVGDDARSISHQMMPKALTQLGLVDALNDIMDKSFSGTSITFKFEHHNIETRLPENIEIGLYRIAQELLNNIIKHSKATHIDVQLMKIKNNCIFIVQDNGKGINKAKNTNGIGIVNITNRLRTLNGNLNMESDINYGTTATIKIALD